LRYRLDELLHDERVLSHEIDELTHRVDELKAAIAEAEFRISQSRIRAPFVGVITERKVEAGQTVKNLEKLFKLSSFSTLFADVFLSEGEARTVDEGQETTITLAVQDTVSEKGRVARISPIVDQATGTIKITVELENHSSKFKPGAFVRVDIETDKHTGSPLVPKRALVEQDGRHYVFVAEGDTVSRVEVKTGFESESQTEILKGVHAGTRVVVAGHGNLKDGSKVKGVDKG